MPERLVEYARSAAFRAAFIDTVVTAAISDHRGVRVQITFMRLDVTPVGEMAQEDGQGSITFQPNALPRTIAQKTVEFAVDMRPDTALAVVNNIISALQQLPPDRKARYGLPDDLQPIQVTGLG